MNKKEFKGFAFVDGGVCAADGFQANGIHCGIKANGNPDKNDLALIYAESPCSAAAMYTTNKVQGAPIAVTRKQCTSDCHTHLVLLLGFQALRSLLLYPMPTSQSLVPHPPCSSLGLIKQPGTVPQKLQSKP